MTTILAPVDFSQVSERVVGAAVTLARAFSGRVVLLNVIQPPIITSEYGMVMENVQELLAVSEKSAAKQLERLREKFASGSDFSIELVQQTGSPVPMILDHARAIAADYIVLGSHGHTALYNLLVGSTASGIVKGAVCPVVLIPPARNS